MTIEDEGQEHMAAFNPTELPIPHPYWAQTHGGFAFDLMNPRPEQLRIKVIAHHLARQCRFGGAPEEHYSTAQHSALVASLVPAPLALRALLHDAHEFVLGDPSGPLLALYRHHVNGATSIVEWYREVHDKAIAARFGLPYPIMNREIAHADALALAAEKRDLLAPEPQPWPRLLSGPEVDRIPKIVPLPYEQAMALFLKTFERLGGVA